MTDFISAMRAREEAHNEDRYPERAECSFATGVFGETVGVPSTRAPVTAISTDAAWRTTDPWPEPFPTHGPVIPALSEEARRGIVRRIERLRCARDTLTQEIAELIRELDG